MRSVYIDIGFIYAYEKKAAFIDSFNHCFSVLGGKSQSNLLCYSEKSGTKMQNCHSSFGFKTCFTKYNYSK